MALGILEPRGVISHVPGTTRYFDSNPDSDTDPNIKFENSGGELVILPSDDPNDPLNWPLWQRDVTTLTLCFVGVLATALGPILAADTLNIAIALGRPLGDVASLTGYYLLGCGTGAVLVVPSARIWGKRHMFILGTCVLIASTAWAGSVGSSSAYSYRSLVAARVVQGIGAAPFESLLNAAVGDLYHVHQRGARMAGVSLAVFGAAFFTPVVAGVVADRLGWQWTFNIVSILAAIALPFVFFLCPETTYPREEHEHGQPVVFCPEVQAERPKPPTSGGGSQQVPVAVEEIPRPCEAKKKKKTFTQSLALFDGRKTDDSYWSLLLRPFPLLANPAFAWACLIQGTMAGWTVFIALALAMRLVGPPYFWPESRAGYAYAGAFFGALLGFVIAGLLADPVARFLTRRNGGGVYEPEFRIILVAPMLVAAAVGLVGFGLTAGQLGDGKECSYPPPPLVFFAFEVAGMVIGAVASSLYIVDAYKHLTIEGFTVIIIFKNMFSFGLTFKAFEWIASSGVKGTMLPIAGVQVAICALSIPMYMFGKRCRAFYHLHDILALVGLR